MTSRRLLLLLPLPLVLALGAWGSAHVAERVGAALVQALSAVASFVATSERKEPEPEGFDDFSLEATQVPVAIALPTEPRAAKGRPAQRGAKAKGQAQERSLFVSAATVLRLAETRARPRGAPVKADGVRPAGLRLVHVAELGVGLRDGDVLTRAVGQPALSTSAVVRAVLLARAKGARVLEGEFWRGGERWVLRVEQPYPGEREQRP